MSLRTNSFGNDTPSFNMTPIIDIVFLLIIFFLVVCQFIEAENFGVDVPDACKFAQSNDKPGAQLTTLTIMETDEGNFDFAVGSEKVASQDNITGKLAELIDTSLKDLPPSRRIVTLRADKDVRFAQVQYALAAVAQSTATDIQLAVLQDRQHPID